jgi:hypothetical protein
MTSSEAIVNVEMFQAFGSDGVVSQSRKDVGEGMSSGDCCCENNHAQEIAHPTLPGMRVSHGTCRHHY